MRILLAFLAGFLASLLGIAACIQVLSGGLLAGFALADPTYGPQVWQILISCSFFFGLVTAITVHTRSNPEIEGLGMELKEGLGNFSKALLLLRHRAFLPLWISLFLAVAGCLMLGSALLGALPLLAGQALWYLSRSKLLSFVERKEVPHALEGPLRALVYITDAVILLGALPIIEALSTYGHPEAISALAAFGAAVVLGFAAALAWIKFRRVRLDFAYPILGIVLSVWFMLLLHTLNYSLDFRPPVELGRVTKQDCLGYREAILAGSGSNTVDNMQYEACWNFDPPGFTHHLDDIAVTNEYFGALGFRWRRYYVQPAPPEN